MVRATVTIVSGLGLGRLGLRLGLGSSLGYGKVRIRASIRVSDITFIRPVLEVGSDESSSQGVELEHEIRVFNSTSRFADGSC